MMFCKVSLAGSNPKTLAASTGPKGSDSEILKKRCCKVLRGIGISVKFSEWERAENNGNIRYIIWENFSASLLILF